MFHFTKKKAAALAAAAAIALTTGVAFAYFTANGSGSGSATVGSSSPITLSSSSVGPLYPGGANVPVAVTVTNPGGGAQHVNQVSGTVADNGTCLGAWFQVDTVTYNTTLAPGASGTANTVVRMLDSGSSQNACQGLSMDINWSSN